MVNGSTRISSTGCAAAEYRGTCGSPNEVIAGYVRSLNNVNCAGISSNAAHNFVFMTVEKGFCVGFVPFVRNNKLGKAYKTLHVKNINHGGWNSKGDREMAAIIFQPEIHELIRWYKKNHDPKFVLNNYKEPEVTAE